MRSAAFSISVRAALAVLAFSLVPLAVGAPLAGAETRVASYSASADAIGAYFTFDQANLLPLSPVLALGGPRAQVLVDSLPRVSARGTPLDPGLFATVGGATGLVVGAIPFANLVPGLPELYEQIKALVLPALPDNPVPPWPFFADSATPGGVPSAEAGFAPAFYGHAATTDDTGDTGTPLAASAEGGLSSLALPGSGSLLSTLPVPPGGALEGPIAGTSLIGLGGLKSSSSASGGETTVAESLMEISDISLLAGFIHLKGLRSHARASATEAPTAEFDVDNITLAGLPVKLMDTGFQLIGGDAVLASSVQKISDSLMSTLGLQFHLLQTTVNEDGHSSAASALSVTFKRTLLPADIPGIIAAGADTVTLQVGFSSAAASRVTVDVASSVSTAPSGGVTPGTSSGTGGGSVSASRPVSSAPSTASALPARPANSPLALTPSSGALAPVVVPDDLAFIRAGVDFRWSIIPPGIVGLLGLYALARLLKRIALVSSPA